MSSPAQDRSLATRTIGGLLWSLAGGVTQAVLQIATVALLARLLSPAQFGVVSAALVAVGLASIVSQLGITPALVQMRHLQRRHAQAGFTLALGLGLVLCATCVAVATPLSAFFRMPDLAPVLRALALTFPLRALGTVGEAMLQRSLRFRTLSTIEVSSYAVGYAAVGIGLAVAGFGVWALVGAQLGQVLVRTAALMPYTTFPFGLSLERGAVRRLLQYGGGLTLAQLAHALAVHGDNLVVGRTLGPLALGIYGRAYQLLVMPASLLGNVLDRVLFPVMAQVRQDRERLARAYRRGIALTSLMTIPASAILVLAAPEVVAVVLGPSWTEVVPPLRILACGLLLRTGFQLGDSLARAVGAVYDSTRRQAVYAASVIVGASLGQRWGLTGVAVGVLAALCIKYVLMANLAIRHTGIRWQALLSSHTQGLAVATPLAAAGFLLLSGLRQFGAPALASLAVLAVLTPALAIALMAAFPDAFLGDDGRWLLERLRERFWPVVRRPPATPVNMAGSLGEAGTPRS